MTLTLALLFQVPKIHTISGEQGQIHPGTVSCQERAKCSQKNSLAVTIASIYIYSYYSIYLWYTIVSIYSWLVVYLYHPIPL